MRESADNTELSQRLRALRHEEVEETEVTLSTNLPDRKQVVRLSRRPGRDIVAETTITTEASEDMRAKIFDWTDAHPLVAFRLDGGTLSARCQFGADISGDDQARLLLYLARLADRLEYKLGEGQDVH